MHSRAAWPSSHRSTSFPSDSVAVAACGTTNGCSPSAEWQFTVPTNTPGGNLDGFEINYQQPLRFLPGVLANTGILLNYTGVKSEVDYLNGAGLMVATRDLTGLSRSSYNATLYYEDTRWSARVSASYRDSYLTRVPGSEAGTDADGTAETLNVDASIQYTLSDHFKLTLEGVNSTDEYQDQFNDSVAERSSFYHHWARIHPGCALQLLARSPQPVLHALSSQLGPNELRPACMLAEESFLNVHRLRLHRVNVNNGSNASRNSGASDGQIAENHWGSSRRLRDCARHTS